MRIISTCPSNTELLAYLGLVPHLVGVDNHSDWPGEIEGLPRLGPDRNIDMDAVEALKPDLVVASLSVPGMEKNVEGLKARGIPHLVLNPKSLEEIGDALLVLGEAVGVIKRAKAVFRAYHAVLDRYRELSARVVKPYRIYWEWWPKPVFTPGRLNWLTDMSLLAGGVNVFGDVDRSSCKTDWDAVLARRPDVIALAWVGVRKELVRPDRVKQRAGWSELPAIQNGRLYIMEEPFFCRPSPRLLLGLRKLAALLHPDLYAPADLEHDPLIPREW